jgi:hypothetical protein
MPWTARTGTEAGDPDVEERRVGYPVAGLDLPLLPAPGAALVPRRLPIAQQRRVAAAVAGHDDISQQGRAHLRINGRAM